MKAIRSLGRAECGAFRLKSRNARSELALLGPCRPPSVKLVGGRRVSSKQSQPPGQQTVPARRVGAAKYQSCEITLWTASNASLMSLRNSWTPRRSVSAVPAASL